MVLIKLTLVLCVLLNLTRIVFGNTCEKRAMKILEDCKSSADVFRCASDRESELSDCPEPKQLLGLTEKKVHPPSSCDKRVRALESSCQSSGDRTKCLTDGVQGMPDCHEAGAMLGLDNDEDDPSEWDTLSCQQRAEKIKEMCKEFEDQGQCLDAGYLMMTPGCQEAASLLGIEGKVTESCETKAATMKGLCDPVETKEKCLLAALLTMTGCTRAEHLLGLDENGGWGAKSCEDRAEAMKELCEPADNKQHCLHLGQLAMSNCGNARQLLGLPEVQATNE